MTGERINVHGTGLVIGPHGLLLRGPSGSGKSLLALDLLEDAGVRGEAALLVADDRVDLWRGEAGLVMSPPDPIRGMIELRGRGILTMPHAEAAPLHLVVDLLDEVERMPESEAFEIEIAGMRVARCPVPRRGRADGVHQRLLVRAALRALG